MDEKVTEQPTIQLDPLKARQTRKDVKRNLHAVLVAAREVFAHHGNDASIEEVANRAGVGIGTVYRRFKSKDRLIAAVMEEARSRLIDGVEQEVSSSLTSEVKLAHIVRLYCRLNEDHASLLDPFLMKNKPLKQAEPSTKEDVHMRFLLEQVIKQGQLEKSFRETLDPSFAAALCIEVLRPRAYINLRHTLQISPEELADHIQNLLIFGLTSGEITQTGDNSIRKNEQ